MKDDFEQLQRFGLFSTEVLIFSVLLPSFLPLIEIRGQREFLEPCDAETSASPVAVVDIQGGIGKGDEEKYQTVKNNTCHHGKPNAKMPPTLKSRKSRGQGKREKENYENRRVVTRWRDGGTVMEGGESDRNFAEES